MTSPGGWSMRRTSLPKTCCPHEVAQLLGIFFGPPFRPTEDLRRTVQRIVFETGG